ncbi:MAG: sigma-54 dependent transcriptional regulator [Candidatus Tectomicrobia bacterium]|nr:sigma-54 dependent transcriptional regulator [Candidatus Tectomicrobia bacterium]
METQTALQPSILVIDDDSSLLTSYTMFLEDHFRLHTAESGEEGLRVLEKEDINIILLDLRLPGMDGMDVLRQAKVIDENVDVIVVTGVKSIRVAVEAIKLGAYDYLVKPFEVDDVLSLLWRTLERQNLVREVLYLRAEVDRHQDMGNIVGQNETMRQIYDLVCRVADTNATVLVSGESGTGKELVARAIHQQSQRQSKPFVAMNCAAISESLVESELFGHERGAFTGAVEKHLGKFELAHTGVLFLDEIGSLRLDMQAKLLRVLQEREFERVGGSKTVRIDVRIVAASNEDLKQLVADKAFRDDLFYRLNVVPVHVPPLRERKDDIPLLAEHFLAKYNKAFNRKIRGISPAALSSLNHYHWPGNVRELENVIERLVAISNHEVIGMDDLPLDLVSGRDSAADEIFTSGVGLREAKAEFERHYILKALEKSRWNQTEAAKRLGVHRNTLLGKMESLHIRPNADSDVLVKASS